MKWLYVFLLLSIFVSGKTQDGFIKAYNFGYPTAVRFNSMMENGNSLALCGYILDSFPPYQQGVFFSKIDTLGQVLSFKVYYDALGNNYVAGNTTGGMIQLQNQSGYLFVGSILENSSGFMMKFDMDSNLIWTKNLEDNTSLQGYYNKIIEVDNGILIGGHKQKQDYQNDIFLIKTDKDGNKLWEKSYGPSNRGDYLENLLKIDNNEYVLGGFTFPNQGVPWEQWHTKSQIFAVDSLGNEKWYWESDPPFDQWSLEDLWLRGLHHDDEGNWYYTTERWEYQTSSNGWRKQGKFIVRDSNFNLIIEKTYDNVDALENHFINLVPLSDGDWLGVGVNNEKVPFPNQALDHNYGYLNRISNGLDGLTQLGDSLWTRTDLIFPDTAAPQQLFFHSAVELPGGNIIAAGYFTGYGYTDHGLLIKVNQHGCIDTTGCVPTNITFVNRPPFTPDLKVWPNPARQMLYFESEQVPTWDRVELLDMTGRVIKAGFANNMLSIEEFPSGMYMLRLWKGERFWVRKVVRH